MSDVDTKTKPEGGGEPTETVESLKVKLTEMEESVTALTAEATRNKHLRRAAEKERDDLKKLKPADSSDKDYKALWTDANDKLTKSLEKAKKADINTALTNQFGKAKVASDKFNAALKLVDSTLVEWDENAGIDGTSVVAAVAKLKGEHPFLFETTVASTDPKKPGDGNTTGSTITRAAFDALSPIEKVAKAKTKVTVID